MIYSHALKPRSRFSAFELLLAAIEIEILLSFEIEDMILNRISFFLSTIYYLFIISSTDRFYDYIYNVRVWIFHDGFTLAFFFLIVRGKVQSEV